MSHPLFDLKGKRALVTGSSRGIGSHLVRGLAEAGASVIVNGMNQSTVESTVSTLQAEGHDAIGKAFDVSDTEAIVSAIDTIESEVGPIDILVNNAGIQRRTPLLDCDDATWQEVMETNLTSVFKVSRAVARHMVKRNSGKIINTCSLQSELGRPTIAPYAASKGGGPGYFATELTAALVENPEFSDWLCKRTPAGRWGKVEELVGGVIFLAAPASSFVNGHILYVDGGMSAVV